MDFRVTNTGQTFSDITGSQALMYALIAEGVDTIFGYPGGQIIPVYNALYDFTDRLHHVLVRHEQGAAHAAEGYARVSGKVGVCFATSGPGATNLITGIADAMSDSVPIVCITGQVPSSALGNDAFQETDIISATIPITKWNYQVTKASEIPVIIAKAFLIASSGRPGPVLIDITKDAQVTKTDCELVKVEEVTQLNNGLPEATLKEIASLVDGAKKPMIFAGQGIRISKAEDALRAFAEKTGIPVAFTLHGLSSLPPTHELNIGMLGMHGNYSINMLSNEADVVIAIGMRFDYRVTSNLSGYLAKSKIIHIEIDPAEIDKVVHVDVPLVSDAKVALEALLPLVSPNQHKEWLAEFRKLDEVEYEKVRKEAIHPSCSDIRMMEVVARLSEKTQGSAIIVSDVGQHQMCAARYYDYACRNSFVTSGGLGTMGFALPASIGVQSGCPDRTVVSIIGDGGFLMTVQELATIVQEHLKVKIIVLNNTFLGMVRQWQELFFQKRYSSVNLTSPDFVKIAEGFGVKAERVENRDDLSSAIDRMLASDGSYLLDVAVAKEDNFFPMVPAGVSITDVRLE